MTNSWANATSNLPAPFDPARAVRTLEALAEHGYVPPPGARALFEAAFGNSPFLARLAVREREVLRGLVANGPRAALDVAQASALAAGTAEDIPAAMTMLRVAKRRAALAIALADIAGQWDLE